MKLFMTFFLGQLALWPFHSIYVFFNLFGFYYCKVTVKCHWQVFLAQHKVCLVETTLNGLIRLGRAFLVVKELHRMSSCFKRTRKMVGSISNFKYFEYESCEIYSRRCSHVKLRSCIRAFKEPKRRQLKTDTSRESETWPRKATMCPNYCTAWKETQSHRVWE